MLDTCSQDTPGIFDWRLGISLTRKHLNGPRFRRLSVQKLKRQNREEAKFLAATVEAVWKPQPSKFLYSEGVAAWMRGRSAENAILDLLK